MAIAYLFPGQGSHEVGMGYDLVENYSEAADLFAAGDEILGFKLSDLCFDGPLDQLTETVNQQPALFVTSVAMLRVMQTEGWDPPDFVAGHSLGEFSALVAANSLSFADGLRLVRRRGELMQAAGTAQPGSMAAVLGLDADAVDAACEQAATETGGVVQLANDNCPGQAVISGETTAVEAAKAHLSAAGAKRVVDLPITIAAHSPLMAAAAVDFAAAVEATPIAAPQIPVVGNTSASPLTSVAEIVAELKAQLTGPVRWTESMTYLTGQGVDTIAEVGSGDVLQKLMRRIDRSVQRSQFQVR